MSDVDQIDLDVKFVIGASSLPLAKLRRLERGAVILLGRDAASPIAVEANGRRIGSASVKLIGDRVAVEIVAPEGSRQA